MLATSALLLSLAAMTPAWAAESAARDTPGDDDVSTNLCAPRDPCQAQEQQKVNQFNGGQLRNSGGYTLPPRIRQMLNASARTQFDQQPYLARRDGEWWRAPLSTATCLAWSMARACGSGSIPDQDRQEMNAVLNETTQVFVVCGGAAAIGSFRGGGWWGAGAGGGSCMWTQVMSRIYGW